MSAMHLLNEIVAVNPMFDIDPFLPSENPEIPARARIASAVGFLLGILIFAAVILSILAIALVLAMAPFSDRVTLSDTKKPATILAVAILFGAIVSIVVAVLGGFNTALS